MKKILIITIAILIILAIIILPFKTITYFKQVDYQVAEEDVVNNNTISDTITKTKIVEAQKQVNWIVDIQLPWHKEWLIE